MYDKGITHFKDTTRNSVEEIRSNIMDTKGLILNTAYNDFILDSEISNYLYKRHTKVTIQR